MRKDCPHNFRANNWALWWQFKTQIKEAIEYKMNLDKNSEFGPTLAPPNVEVKETVVTDVEGLKEQELERERYWKTVEKVKVEANGKHKEIRGKLVDGNNYVAIRDIVAVLNENFGMNIEVDWNQGKQEIILKK